MKKYLKSILEGWTTFEKVWLVVATAIIIICSIMWKSNWIGITASLTGIWCVVLVAKARISNFFFGLINALTYGIVAFGWQYYGEVMLNIGYFLPMQVVGIFLWMKRSNRSDTNADAVVVRTMRNSQRLLWGVISILGLIGYGIFLANIHRIPGLNTIFPKPNRMPFIDSTSTILSVIAMVMMNWRFLEQWVLWIIVDVVSIIMWWVVVVQQGGNDIAVLLMWSAFLINAVYGLYNWAKMYKAQKGVAA